MNIGVDGVIIGADIPVIGVLQLFIGVFKCYYKVANKNDLVDIGVSKVIVGADVGVIGALQAIIFINKCDN